jgi:acetylglutamate kinase
MNKKLTIIKVGGALVENSDSLALLLRNFADVDGYKILVHGGGRSATALATQLGIESKMVEGRRITDADMLRVAAMVYGGLVNKTIVAKLQGLGVDAIGLTGADLNIIRSDKRPVGVVDYGFVGDVKKANGGKLASLLEMKAVPVIAPLTHDGNGQLLNTNADTIASTVAVALSTYFDVTLTYCFEKPGVMSNPDDESSLIPEITADAFQQYVADGTVSGGMIPKIENALAAVKQGVKRVVITSANNLNGGGTVIR